MLLLLKEIFFIGSEIDEVQLILNNTKKNCRNKHFHFLEFR